MSVSKAILFYCMGWGIIKTVQISINYLKSEKVDKDVFIGSLLYSLIIGTFIKLLTGIVVTIFLKWLLSLFNVVTDNDLVYVGIYIVIDLILVILCNVLGRKQEGIVDKENSL